LSKPVIITVSGKAQHGKNTFADLLQAQSDYDVMQIAYADYLKYVATQYFGWNGKKDIEGRTLLQRLGTEMARVNNPDIWVNIVIELIKGIGNRYDFVVITDCRFPNEIKRWQEEGFKVIPLIVERMDFDNGLTNEQKNHPSEIALEGFEFEYRITAKDTIDLSKEVDYFIKELRRKYE
jgi:hypothetical protein